MNGDETMRQVKVENVSEAQEQMDAAPAQAVEEKHSEVEQQNDAVTASSATASSVAVTHDSEASNSIPAPAAYDSVVFKVPELPVASASVELASTGGSAGTSNPTSPPTVMSGLPADIEHILSLGAAEPDPADKFLSEALPTGSATNYEQVVRDMKARHFTDKPSAATTDAADVSMESGEDVQKRTELEDVEKEMASRGVTRDDA